MAIALALCSALAYGVSDYVGGRTSRRVPPVVVSLLGEITLLAVFLVVIPLVEDGAPPAEAYGWGVVAGVAGGLGVLGLYAALSRGNMTVVAPVTGVVAAAVPVTAGVALGERPGGVAVAGIVAAILAVALVGGALGAKTARVDLGTVVLAVLVGCAFGALFIAYAQTGDDSGLWPLLTARLGGTPLLVLAFVLQHRRRPIGPIDRVAVSAGMTVGLLVAAANALYLLSTRAGLLSLVAVIVSLYPASTVLLASALDGERASRSQVAGMAIAAIAVALIALGS